MTTFKTLARRLETESYYSKPNLYGEEGEDHINISVSSQLKLGRLLDPGYCHNFEYPHIGSFKSILALGYWLRSKDLDDEIRMMKGRALKDYIAKHELSRRRIPNYVAIVANATWIRVQNRPDVIEEIKNLPEHVVILSYHIKQPSGLRITTPYASFIVPVINEIVRAIKAGESPNFDQFVTDRRVMGMDYLEGVLKRHLK